MVGVRERSPIRLVGTGLTGGPVAARPTAMDDVFGIVSGDQQVGAIGLTTPRAVPPRSPCECGPSLRSTQTSLGTTGG